MTVYNKDYAEGNYVMVLDDAETYTGVSGCCTALVLWNNAEAGDAALTDQEMEVMISAHEAAGKKIWIDKESGLVAEVVEIYV